MVAVEEAGAFLVVRRQAAPGRLSGPGLPVERAGALRHVRAGARGVLDAPVAPPADPEQAPAAIARASITGRARQPTRHR